MSSTKSLPSLKQWLILLPDHPDKLSDRNIARPDHLKNVRPSVDSGRVLIGGAMLSKQPAEGQTGLDMVGSVFLMTAETEEELRAILERDVYATRGVWDMSQVKIWPFKTAVKHGAKEGEPAWE